MIRLLLQFEAFYQLKQKAFLLFVLIFFGYGLLAGNQGFAPANVNFNSGYQINFFTSLLTLGSVFAIMFFAVSGVLRDRKYGLEPMIFSTAIKKHHYFLSRFIGLYLFSLLAFVPFLLGYGIAVSFGDLDPERVAIFSIASYFQPLAYIIIPNIFICCSILFAVSILTKNNVATYIGAVVIYALYFICSIFLNSPLLAGSVPASPETMAMAALLDPFGVSAFFEQTQYWTAHQKNTQLLSFSGLYFWNRIIWILMSIGMLGITYRAFSFRSLKKPSKQKFKKEKTLTTLKAYQPVVNEIGSQVQRQAFLSILKLDLKGVVKSLPFLVVMLIWFVIVISSSYAHIYEGGAYGDSWHPFTNLLIAHLVDPLTLFGIILIVFYSGDVLWKEREMNFNGIIDSTPVSNWVFFLSKLLSLFALPITLISSAILIAIGFQISSGYYHLELGQYLAMYYINGLQLFLFCIIAVFIQTLTRHKFLGMGLTAVIVMSGFLANAIGIEHPLLRTAFLPRISYSNMTGYSGDLLQFNNLALYWVGLIGILGLLSFKLWQRGINTAIKNQLIAAKSNWKSWERLSNTALIILFVLGGSNVYYQTNVASEYMNTTDILDYRETYERKYKALDSLPRMYQTSMKTEVSLYSNDGKYKIKAKARLTNRENVPLRKLFITERITIDSISLENAKLIMHDKEFGAYLFEFIDPILPGQEVTFEYLINYANIGYEVNGAIADNGSYLTHRSFEPILKYREALEVSDPFERKRRRLSPKEEEIIADAHLSLDDIKMGRIDFETVVSTDGDEIALSSGRLIKKWSAEGRNFYHYKTTEKVIPSLAYFSAPYEVKTDRYQGITIEQYYHPDHAFNIDSITSSTKAALGYCMDNFGSYPNDHLRIAEIPSIWPFGGFAHPGMISMVEDRLYLSDISKAHEFNLVAKRTIHEVAHQWWGHLLVAKIVPGGSVFVESFAKYTEGVVMDKVYGKRAIIQLSETARNRYFNGRAYASEAEPPLYLVYGQSYLSYGKGLTVMMALRELMGEAQLNLVLRELVEEHKDKESFELTTLMFLDKLYARVSSEEKTLIDDWFKRVITYDLGVDDATTKRLSNGQYEVTIKLHTKRAQTNNEGEEVPIGINESIQVGLFSESLSISADPADIIYLEPVHFNESESEVKIMVSEQPKYVSIDPYGTRSEEDVTENTLAL